MSCAKFEPNAIKRAMLLYAVTDRSWTQDLIADIEAALRGGVTCVQLREKNLPREKFEAEAFEVKTLCKQYNVPFIINDDVSLAAKCKSDGVHIGQGDIPLSEARAIVGKDIFIGVSVQKLQQALEAERGGADYLGVGAIFPTSTKSDAVVIASDDDDKNAKAAPLIALRRIRNVVKLPIVAIGGINASNMNQLIGIGVDGVAIVSAIFTAGSPEKITARCRELRDLAENYFTANADMRV